VTRWGVQIPSSGFPYWLFQGWVAGNGGELTNAAGTATYFDHPAAVEALDHWVALSQADGSHPPGIVEWGSTPDDFLQQRAAMIWTTSGNLADIAHRAGFEFGVAALPGKERAGSPTGGGNFYLFKHAPPAQREAALTFVRWMSSPQQAAQWSRDTGYIPVRKSAWDEPLLKHHAQVFPPAAVAHAALEHCVPELSTHENQRVTRMLDEALYAALTGKKSSVQALGEAQAGAMRILRPYQR
jgi:sn-glycerol 3-phosphate transport system substrate-binding protein